MPAPVPPSHVARQTTSARRQARTKRLAQMILLTLLLSALLPLVSACGADPRVQQEKDQSLTKLTQLLKHAQDIGVPSTTLHPILTQKQNLDNSSAPGIPSMRNWSIRTTQMLPIAMINCISNSRA